MADIGTNQTAKVRHANVIEGDRSQTFGRDEYMKHKSFGLTDVGLVRTGNEDYFYIDEANGLYVVCDGMGGHQAGEVASKTASQTIKLAFQIYRDEILNDSRLCVGADLPPTGRLLVSAIRFANRRIHNQSTLNPSLSGMGTTVVALVIEQDNIYVAHVGDSRAYRLETEKLSPLTVDHSWISEVRKNSNISEDEVSNIGKNIITRALGVRENVEVDYTAIPLSPGDIYILCSDGLCGAATDEEIFEVANKDRKSLESMARHLIDLANANGGNDNSTVIVVQIGEVQKSDGSQFGPITCAAETPELLDVEDEWLARIEEEAEEETIQPTVTDKAKGGGGSPNRFFLMVIFGAFIILAGLLVYFSSGK